MSKIVALFCIALAFYLAWLSLVIVAGSTTAALWVILYAFGQSILVGIAGALVKK